MDDPAGLLRLIGVLAPIFALIGLGFGLGRAQVFSPEQVRGLARFVLLVALPALLVNALARADIGAVFRLDYLLVYGGASLACLAVGFATFRFAGGETIPRSAVRGMGMANSNSAFIALPIGTLIFGPAAAGPVALNLIFENLLLFPLVLILIEIGQSGEHHPGRVAFNVAKRLVRSPMLIAIVLGGVIAVTGRVLPDPAVRTLGMLSAATAPLALITIGTSLAGTSLHGKKRAIGTLAVGKLVIHPLLVFLLLFLVPIREPVFRSAAILYAAMPMMSIFPVIAQRSDDVETASAALLVTTVLSFGTLLVVMLLLGIHL